MVTRHFVTLDGQWGPRQVHYRRAGEGPALLMLHQSPKSSADLLPLIHAWQSQFTIIAPDSPGFGLSDPLGIAHAPMETFAAAALELADALGLRRFGVFGFHTGASMAVALARTAPERVTACAANGLVSLTAAEREDILAHYLPPLEILPDGSHLAALWNRMRDQSVFFPWYRRTPEARMDLDPACTEAVQDSLVELLRAGDHYRVGYRAAFTFDPEPALVGMTVPTLVTAAAPDPLVAHLARLPADAAAVQVRTSADGQGANAACLAQLQRHPGDPVPPAPATAPLPGQAWQRMVEVPGGQLRVHEVDAPTGRPLLLQHDATGSGALLAPMLGALAGRRPALSIDLAGHGDSDAVLAPEEMTIERHREVISAALAKLGIDGLDAGGFGAGGLVALELARAAPGQVHRLVLAEPPASDPDLAAELREQGLPAWQAQWYGGHLLLCWHMVRDQALFHPWYRRRRAGIIWQGARMVPEEIHARVLELQKAPEATRLTWQAQCDYPLAERLAALSVPTLLCAPRWSPAMAHAEALHAAQPHCAFQVLPEAPRDWAPAFAEFCDR